MTGTHGATRWFLMARARLVRLLAVGLAASLAGIIVCAGAASAASQSKGYGQMKAGDVWYGNYKNGTERGYCGDPIAGGANLYAPTANGGTSYGAVTPTSSWNPKTTGVGALSATNVHRLAYVLSVHGQTNSNAQAAHVSYAVRTFVASPGGAKGSAVPYAGDIKTEGVKLVGEAKKYAGPYAITPKLSVTADKQAATLTGYRPISATGATMTGYAGTLTVTGPGVFDSNNETTMTAPADGRAVTIRATGDGTVTVKVTYDKLPTTGLYYRKPANDKYQRILISGRTAPVSGTATTTVDALNQPKVITQASDQVATAGSELTDTLVVSDLAPGSTVTVTSTLYGPFSSGPAESPTPPAGAAVAGTASTEVMAGPDGTTTAVTRPITIETSGYYVWFETTDATPENAAWPGQFGQASETTLVKWTPIVTTETSQQRATPGARLTDTLTVTGLPPRTQVEVTSTLYGPFTTGPSESATVPDEAPVVGTITTPVTADEHGEATATTEALTVEKRGYYVWHETIAAGNEHEAWPGRFGQTSETTIVPWQPAVTTQTSDQTAAPGAKITDTLTVTGLQPGATVQIITTLYGPFTDQPVPADAPPTDAPQVGTLTLEVTAGADGNATAITKSLTVKGPGFYVWREMIAATDEQEAWAGRFGVESETTDVVAPATPPTPPVPPAPPVPPTPDVPHLPDTGAGATPAMIALAAVLIAAGGTLVGFGIRRLRHDTIQSGEWTPGESVGGLR